MSVMADGQEMDTSLKLEISLGVQIQCETFCLAQTAELTKSCTKTLKKGLPRDSGDISVIPAMQSSSHFLYLPQAPRKDQTESKNLNKSKSDLPMSKHNRDAPRLPFKIADTCDIIPSIESVSQGNTSVSENANSTVSLEEQWALEEVLLSSITSAVISTLLEDVYLHQIFSLQTDLELFKVPTPNNTKDAGATVVDSMQKKASVVKSLLDPVRKEEENVSEPNAGTPNAQIQLLNAECLMEGVVVVGRAAAYDSVPDNTTKGSHYRAEKAESSRPSKAKGPKPEKTKMLKEAPSKKSEEQKQPRSQVKAEEKLAIPKTKRKGHPPELSQEAFKKPRSSLAMHMEETVQVFHALGRKSEEKMGMSLSRALRNTHSTKYSQLSSAIKSGLHIPGEGTGTLKTQGTGQKPEGSADTKCPSSSQCELPPPGKVRLVPLPFLRLDKAQACPVPRRPPNLASQRAPARDPAKPPTANPSHTAAARTSVIGLTKSGAPVSTSLQRPVFNNHTRPRVSQSVASMPVPYKTSFCTSLHKEPVSTAQTKPCSPPQSHTQYLLEDFSHQPIPWRKVDFPGPVVSTPFSDEQRQEIIALKRKAQRERENAATYTALGKVQGFLEKEKDMEIAQYFGCVL